MKSDHENKDLEDGDAGVSVEPGTGRKVPRFFSASPEIQAIKETVEKYNDIIESGITKDQPNNLLNGKYAALYSELMSAYTQASAGKGKERHANDEPFEQQKILVIQRWLGESPISGVLFQAAKKVIEAARLSPEAAIAELDGATVYLQAGKIRLRELLKEAK